MGCIHPQSPRRERVERGSSRRKKSTDSMKKEYTWEKREKVDPKDYTIENMEEGEAGRLPGTVNGQQFIIQNCKNTNIYVFDHINTVTIDDCINCKIFLGPVKGSVFIRDCTDCVCVVACGQFRIRDCRRLTVFLCCATQPIIESSTGVYVGCYHFYYPELEAQFHSAELSPFNNNWSDIHDFTPVEVEKNWTLLPENAKIGAYFPAPVSEDLSRVRIDTSHERSVVPLTGGERQRIYEEAALVAFFSDGQQQERARSLIAAMKVENPDCNLVSTREILLQCSDAERVFKTSSYSGVVERGQVIGLEYNGPACIQSCQKVGMDIATSSGSTGLIYVSSNPKTVHQQIDTFFTLTQMQMSGEVNKQHCCHHRIDWSRRACAMTANLGLTRTLPKTDVISMVDFSVGIGSMSSE